MAAIRPIVLVYQDFANVTIPVSLPDLNVTIVGPAYRIYDYASDKANLSLGAVGTLVTPAVGNAAAAFVSLVATPTPFWTSGDVLDAASVKLYADEGYAEMAYDDDGVVAVNQNTLTSAAGDFLTKGVQAGDRVVVTGHDGANTVAKTIQSVTATVLTLTTNFAVAGVTTAIKYRVERPISGVAVNEAVTIDTAPSTPTLAAANITVNVGGAGKRLTYAKLYAQYAALRTDIGDSLVEIRSTDDIESKIGKLDERNPLAVGAFVAFQNGGQKKITALGLKESNAVLGHASAQDVLRGRNDVYAIVPLTEDKDIIASWKTHAATLSVPEVAKFRVIIGSTALPTGKSVYTPSGTPGATEVAVNGAFRLVDNAATFIATGVAAGDIVTISATPYPVKTVESENALVLTGVGPGAQASIGYAITRVFTKAQQVEELSNLSKSINSKRCVLVWPGECSVKGVTNAATGLASHQPGYYIAAAVGGQVAGLPPQQGFTYYGFEQISEIYKSNTYFYEDQLDALMNAGWYVVVQDSPLGLPYSIHAITTDVTTLESQELMVVKNFDYVSMAYRDALVGFLGRYNVIPETMSLLRGAFDAVTDTLRLRRYPKVGAPVLDAEITSISVDPGSSDKVDIYATVTLPRPLNRIGLHLTA